MNDDDNQKPLLDDDTIADPPLSKERKRAVLVSVITMFLGSVMFSITLPTMAFFYEIVENAATVELRCEASTYKFEELGIYGFIVASFSLGQAISSPLFGKWYNVASAKWSYIVGLIFLIGGSMLYFFSYTWQMMLIARLLVGVGSGTATVCRSHVANAVPIAKRTGAMALVAAAQAVGFIIGPAFALIFTTVNIELKEGYIYFDQYTAPGLSSAAFGVLNLLLVLIFFKESAEELRAKGIVVDDGPQVEGTINDSADDDQPLLMMNDVPYDVFAIMLNMVIFFFVTTGFSVFEAIGTPFTAVNLGWSAHQNSIFFTVAGCASIFSFIAVKPLAAKIGDRASLVVGLILMTAGLCGRMCSMDENGVCHISEAQYWATTLTLYTIGYPISNAVCFGIFAKIMGPAAQGTMTGWQMFVGSVARMIGPIWASTLFSMDDTGRSVFGVTAGCTLISAIIVLIFWKRFVPWGEGPDADKQIIDKHLQSPVGSKSLNNDYGGGH